MEKNSKKDFIIDVLYLFLVILLIFLFAFFLFKYLFPFLIGGVISFTVQKPSLFLEKKTKIPRGVISAFLAVAIYFLIGAIFVFLIYRLIIAVGGFGEKLPEIIDKINILFDNLGEKYSSFFNLLPDNLSKAFNGFFENTLEKFGGNVGGFITRTVSNIAKNTPRFFITSIVTLVATCNIAKDFPLLCNFLKNLFGQARSERIVKIKDILVFSVFKLIKGYLILSLITFFELAIGLLVLRVEYPILIGFLISLVDILPVLGTGIIMIPWAVILSLNGNISLSIGIAVLYIIVVIVRNFLEPKIIGKQIGINSLFTLIAMFVGLKILGVLGMILFPIILIVVIRYYKEDF